MGSFCHDSDFRSGILDLASERRVDHCGVDEVSTNSLHSGSCSWWFAPLQLLQIRNIGEQFGTDDGTRIYVEIDTMSLHA
jgi:hypothetical protein